MIHVPLSAEAQAEARLADVVRQQPAEASGRHAGYSSFPGYDLGFLLLTIDREEKGTGMVFATKDERCLKTSARAMWALIPPSRCGYTKRRRL